MNTQQISTETPMTAHGLVEVDASKGTRIATYADGSGIYRITRLGDYMITSIGDREYGEQFAQVLTRAAEFDQVADRDEWMLTDDFGSSPDYGTDGVVWIGNEAYTVEWADCYLIGFPVDAPTLAESVALVVADQRESYETMGVAEAVDHARNTLSTPEQGAAIGGMVVEVDGDDDVLGHAYLAVLRATPADLIAAEAAVCAAEAV